MALYALRAVELLVGLDYRTADFEEYPLEVARGTPWMHPADHFGSSLRSGMASATLTGRPFVTDDPHFDTSIYPPGTLFVGLEHSVSGAIVVRAVGDGANPKTVTGGVIAALGISKRYGFLYHALGVPAGASGSIQFTRTFGGTVLATITVTADGTYEVPEFVGSDTDTLSVIATWSGGTPRYEAAALHPDYCVQFYAVPPVLPVGFTARTESDVNRGGTFGDRRHADPTGLRAGPHVTFENLGVLVDSGGNQLDSKAGAANFFLAYAGSGGAGGNYNLWVGGALRRYDPFPITGGGAYQFSANTFLPDWTSTGFNPPWPGFNPNVSSVQIIGGTTAWTLDIVITGTASFTVEVWAGPVGAETVQSTGSYAASTTVVTANVQPAALGDVVSIIIKVFAPGSYWTGTCAAKITVTSLADLPLPFSVAGRKADGTPLLAPGGYIAGKLGTPLNARPCTRLATGVASSSNAGWETVVFRPAANGWFQVTYGASPLTAIGEGAFDHDGRSLKSIDRGHLGRPFHSKVDGIVGAPTPVTLVPYTPAPAAIAAGGSVLKLDKGSWWNWGSIAAPAAGVYQITVTLVDAPALQRGVRIGWSLSDPAVVDPEGQVEFLSYDLLYQIVPTYLGIGSAPPAAPAALDTWILGPDPTGLWAGLRSGTVVVWDEIAHAWRPFTPKRGSFLTDAVHAATYWFDGTAWRALSEVAFTFTVAVPAAQVINLVAGAVSSERTGSPGSIRLAWGPLP